MNELDLGPIQVKVTPVPTGKPQATHQMTIRNDVQAGDPALRDMAKPGFLPAGLTFSDATVVDSPVHIVVSTYFDPDSGRSLLLAQTPIAEISALADEKATLFVVGEDVEEISVGGQKGARVVVSTAPEWRGAKASVVWVTGRNAYQLSGRGTSESELMEIAASI